VAQNPEVNVLRLVFLGSDPIALPLLDWLAGEGGKCAGVVGVFTQPDRPAGRGQQVAPNAIKQWAQARKLPVYQPEKITPEASAQLASLQPDVVLVMAYGQILPEDMIAIPRLGTLNLHTSLLPHYRGASPIQTAVASGEKVTGVSLMRIVRQLDAGPVAEVERVTVDALDTALEVESKLAAACVPLLARCLPRLAEGMLTFFEQDHAAATFCRKLAKTDGTLDFSRPATELAARINGLYPWPTCAVGIGGQSVKFGSADALSGSEVDYAPGDVLGADAAGALNAEGPGILRIHRLQRPGGRMLPAAEFLRGFPIAVGTRLESHAMPPLVAREPFKR